MERNAIDVRRGRRAGRGAFAARALLPLLAVLALLLATGCQTGEPVSAGLDWNPGYVVEQGDPNLCWAAAATMAHRYLRDDAKAWGPPALEETERDQKLVADVASRILGLGAEALDDKSAGRLKVLAALVPEMTDMTTELIRQSIELILVARELQQSGDSGSANAIYILTALQWADLLLSDDRSGVVAGLMQRDGNGKLSPALVALAPREGTSVGHIVLLIEVVARPTLLFGNEAVGPDTHWEIESLRYVDPADGSTNEIVGAEEIERRVVFMVNTRQAEQKLRGLGDTLRALQQDPGIAAMLAKG